MAKPNYMAHGGRGYDSKERFYNAGERLNMEVNFRIKKSESNGGEWFLYGDNGLIGVYADLEGVGRAITACVEVIQ